MWIRFAHKPYTRPFKSALKTAHGSWQQRQGIVVRVDQEDGSSGFGEAAPLPWFGTESLAAALEFCASLPDKIHTSQLPSVPDSLPACQFAIASALEQLKNPLQSQELSPKQLCGLLPAGPAALTTWQQLWQQGYRTFKWKVGVWAAERERNWFQQLRQSLPPEAQLRLDANGGLTLPEAEIWLSVCDALGGTEFFEQPLPPSKFLDLLALSQRHATPIALDESVATNQQLKACLARGWHGIVVVKPAIAGAPQQLQTLCRRYGIDAVVSSVFETGIGRRSILALAAAQSPTRAWGLGTFDYCDDDWDYLWGEGLWRQL